MSDEKEEDCKCVRITGELEAVQWLLDPRHYKPSRGPLALGDWSTNQYSWLYYVQSDEGMLKKDDVLKSTHTRYWSIHDPQRYYLGDLHCEKVLLPSQYPNLRMPSQLGSYLWKANTALKLPSKFYQKLFLLSLDLSLLKIETVEAQMDKLIISDQLIPLDRFDYFKRQSFFRKLMNIVSFQDRLQLISLENLCCSRLEGVQLIQHIACYNAKTLKYLFLWRFVLPNENPLWINYSYITGSGQYIPRPGSHRCFLRCLAELRNLRVLALEYSHIADGTGGALIALLPVINKPHFRLQLICREDHVPGRADAALGVGGYGIPDTAWKRVTIACPDIHILMAFFRIRDYDNVRRFLTPSIPLRETHLQYGIDMKMAQRQDSDVSCFVRHIAYRYASTLATFSIHQWRLAVFPLRRVFELMPHLVRFFYVGRVEDDVDLKRMLEIISCGVCDKLKQVNIQIEDEYIRRDYWDAVVKNIRADYEDIFKLYNIVFCIGIYKH